MWKKRNACTVVVGKPEGRRPRGTPGHKQEVNIEMNLRELQWWWGLGFGWLRIGTVHGLYNPNYWIFLILRLQLFLGGGECFIKLSCSCHPKLHQPDLQSRWDSCVCWKGNGGYQISLPRKERMLHCSWHQMFSTVGCQVTCSLMNLWTINFY
jgi:hypothetical protein